IACRTVRIRARWFERATALAPPLIVVFQLMELWRWPVALGLRTGGPHLFDPPFHVPIAAAGVCVAITLGVRRSLPAWLCMLPLAGLHAAIGCAVISLTPDPKIDVVEFHRAGITALLEGQNPYTVDMPNIAGVSAHPVVAITQDGKLDVGFPYLPMPLLLGMPSQILLGDYRYGCLAAIEIAALLLSWLAGRRRLGFFATVVFLFTPRTFLVVQQGWNEPFSLLLVVAALVVVQRWPRWVFLPLGLMLASKQYLGGLLALFPLLRSGVGWSSGRDAIRTVLLSIGVAFVVVMIVCRADLAALNHSAFEFHHRMPWRPDSLSFSAWFSDGVAPGFGSWTSAVAGLSALALVFCFRSRGGAAFCAAAGLSLTAGFAFASQAFANYYFFAIGMFCAGAVMRENSAPGLDAASSQGLNPARESNA
ncbi:MAG: hypothetical protein ACKV2T_08350, partial [Kofleriaceae bacterium]